jgi:hypothetical protein|nr:MAG TPA: hypothetical protein [Caudoviricetes sp.]
MVSIDLFSRGDVAKVIKPILDNSVRSPFRFGIPMRAILDYGILGNVKGVAIPLKGKDLILFISSKKSILCHSGAFVLEHNPLWRHRCLLVYSKNLTYVDCFKV